MSGEGSGERMSDEPSFDLDSFSSRYEGSLLLQRLLFVAQQSEHFKRDALRMALEAAKRMGKHLWYKRIAQLATGLDLEMDESWIPQAETQERAAIAKIEADLEHAKANAIKEKTRMCYNDLGDFRYSQGDYNGALKAYGRARDYCTNTAHHVQSNLNLIKASIGCKSFAHVINFVSRARGALGNKPEDTVTLSKLNAAAGLAHFAFEEFGGAAAAFLDVELDLGKSFSDVITCEDVALYGGIVCLATYSREQLKEDVLGSSTFRTLLELAPLVRDILNCFVHSNYSELFSLLSQLEVEAKMDMYLHASFPALLRKIHSRALRQYVFPYSSVDLNLMASAFGTSLANLEDKLADLIAEGTLGAKIDHQIGFLLMWEKSPRLSAYEDAIALGTRFACEARKAMLLNNLYRTNIFLPTSGRKKGKKRLAANSLSPEERVAGGGGSVAASGDGFDADVDGDEEMLEDDEESDSDMMQPFEGSLEGPQN